MRVLNKMLRRILRVYYSISTQGLHTEQVKRLTTEKLLSLSKKKMYRCTFPKMTKCLVDEVFRSYRRKFRHFVIKRIPRSQLHVLSSLRVQKTTDIGINHLTLWTFSKTCLEQCFARISRSAKKKCSGRLGTIPF